MILTRDKGMRMWGGARGNGGGGGGLNAAALAGFATQAWVDANYVGIPFFNQLFTIHGKEVVTVVDGTTGEETTTTTERDLLPNEVAGTISTTDEETGDVTTTVVTIESIEAKAGVWTNFFVSALGLNDDGGGGGGATTLAGLTDVQLTTPIGNGQALVYDSNLGKWKNATIEGGGGGTGTVTSVAMSVPTGFRVTGSPITTSGTLALAFATGYSLPTTAKQANWDTAFSNMHTHENKTVLDGITATKVADWDDAAQGLSTVAGRVSTLEGYFTGGVANSAARLSDTASRTVWGQTYWQNGVPRSVTGALTSVTNITMSGKITIGGFVIEVVNGDLKFNGNIFATGGVSALGQDSQGGTLTLNDPLRSINNTLTANPTTSGQTLVWNGSRWTYGTGGGSGSVTSVAMTVPTGFTISGSPITSSGTLALGFASGYRLLTSEDETVIGYGYQAYNWGKPAGTFWGNAWENGETLADSITINNGQSVSFKDAGGTARNVVTLNSSNNFALGYGTRKAGYVTDIQGAAASTAANTATAIQFKVGLTEAGIIGMKILKDGTVHIPTSSPGLRIGDALLTYTNDGLKVSALNGTGAMNLYATGGVSALGMSSGGSSSVLPVPTSSDNGKILIVANGEYVLSNPTTLYSGSSAPSSSQGNDGDVYLQLS